MTPHQLHVTSDRRSHPADLATSGAADIFAAAAAAFAGLRHIILTMGSQGAALLMLQPQQQHPNHPKLPQPITNGSSSRRGRQQLIAYHIPAAPAAAVVNLSGAGDTLTGGFAAALLRGASLQEALAVGVAAARLAVECRLNVPGPSQGMQYSSVWQQAQQLLSKLQVWEFPCGSAL
jgi:sugar/nucleoside kinase (ribokinase family)